MEPLEEIHGDGNDLGATDPPTPADDRSRWQPTEILVKGQRMVVESREKAIELMQKGARFERGQEQTNKEREAMAAEKARIEAEKAELARLREVDQYLRENPEVSKKVNAILQGQELPEETDDPYVKMIQGQSAQIAQLARTVEKLQSGVQSGFSSFQRSRALDSEETNLRRKYGKMASDERIDEARHVAESRGLSLDEAFRITSFDDVPDLVRGEVLNEFGLDPATISPQRSEDLNVDGIGPMTEATLQKLYDDPDAYARVRPQLRAWRLARSGKRPAIR